MSKGDETRERILVKAAELFNLHGLEGTSMADLMEATGLEKGGIYRHFPSKEAVAAEAFDYAWEEAFQERVRDLGSVSGSVERLKHLIANFVERRSSIPGGCPLLNTAVEADDGNLVLRERARQARQMAEPPHISNPRGHSAGRNQEWSGSKKVGNASYLHSGRRTYD